ncbi:glycosyltransferase family 2 protein [Jiangella rhizosphaerae]|uniref:Glycosyltransferase n=1 Tax=Jiangella rhizosphaerae TaxID=2293569 RepID=A0A418KVD3_9ACTN|nr:glycosyltransferase family 2 protein [Jiangella rhizosphaerae]RIQ34031.1 glycosyltransferase [Jiangella rhizosphaerae]
MITSIVVPCYREADGLPALYARLAAMSETVDTDMEFVFVDDGSTDDTPTVLRKLAESDPRVKYLALSRNFGKEAAMLAGLRAARGDAVVIMDADLQHPPELVPRLLDEHLAGADQVVARRDRSNDSPLRRTLSRLYFRAVNSVVDVRLVDGEGDFRLLSRRALDALLSLTEYNRFSKGLFAWIGFPVAVVPFRSGEREHGRSSWSLESLVNYGVDGILSFNSKPLRSAIHAGVLLVVASIAYLVWQIVNAVTVGVDTPGYLTSIAAIIGLGGAQMILLGIIGEYVGRIFLETKRRPHFIVMESNVDRSRLPR